MTGCGAWYCNSRNHNLKSAMSGSAPRQTQGRLIILKYRERLQCPVLENFATGIPSRAEETEQRVGPQVGKLRPTRSSLRSTMLGSHAAPRDDMVDAATGRPSSSRRLIPGSAACPRYLCGGLIAVFWFD